MALRLVAQRDVEGVAGGAVDLADEAATGGRAAFARDVLVVGRLLRGRGGACLLEVVLGAALLDLVSEPEAAREPDNQNKGGRADTRLAVGVRVLVSRRDPGAWRQQVAGVLGVHDAAAIEAVVREVAQCSDGGVGDEEEPDQTDDRCDEPYGAIRHDGKSLPSSTAS